MTQYGTIQLSEQEIQEKGLQLTEYAQSGDFNGVKSLLESLSEVSEDSLKQIINLKDDFDQNSLHLAAIFGNIRIAKLLLANGANINATDGNGNTALHLAAIFDKIEIVKFLLENRANINATDDNGNTALCLAVYNGQTETTRILLKKGADVSNINKEGKNAMHFATVSGYIGIRNILSVTSAIKHLLNDDFEQNPQEKTRLIGQINTFLNPAPNETDDAKKERESITKDLAGFAYHTILSDDILKNKLLACFDNKIGKLDEKKYTEFFDKYFPGIEPQFKTDFLAKNVFEKITNAASTGLIVNLDKALGLLTPDIITIIGSERVNDIIINSLETSIKRAIAKAAVSGMPLKDANTNIVLPPEIGLIIGSLIPLNAQNLGDLPGVNKDAYVNARDEREAYLNKVKNILTDLKNPDGSRVFPDDSPVIKFINEHPINKQAGKTSQQQVTSETGSSSHANSHSDSIDKSFTEGIITKPIIPGPSHG